MTLDAPSVATPDRKGGEKPGGTAEAAGAEAAIPPSRLAVVVMSVGAPTELAEAVRSLARQTIPVEIVVVNSDGGDVPWRLGDLIGSAKLLSFEERLLPGAARNRGIAASEAPVLAFLAADCTVEADWAEKRLARHESGALAVASSVVNGNPTSIVACASHAVVYANRLPGLSDDMAMAYGASYARRLFVEHGTFREDLRIGEDTEFHQRLGRRNKPVWAPEVRTAHRTPSGPFAALKDLYGRGYRSGRHWPQYHRAPLQARFRDRLDRVCARVLAGLEGAELRLTRAALPLVALNVAAYEIGLERGRRRPDRAAVLEWIARRAAKAKNWRRALHAWTKALALRPDQVAFHLGRGQALHGLGRFVEAVAAFEAALAASPDDLVALEGLAKASARTRDWQRSLDAWTSLRRANPDRPRAREGVGTALLELGRIDEAEAIFTQLRETQPRSPAGLAGLARVVETREQWAEAAELHAALWVRFRKPESIRRQVEHLVRLNRLPDAKQVIAAREAETRDDPAAYVQAAVVYHNATFDWPAIVDLLQGHEALLRADIKLLERYVVALSALGRADAALGILDGSEAGSAATRQRLRLWALIASGREAEARSVFTELWRDDEPIQVSPGLLAPLLTAACEVGGPDHAEAILDRVVAEASETTHIGETIRTIGPFLRARIDSLKGLQAQAPLVATSGGIEEQLLAALDGFGAGTKVNVALLREFCGTFLGLRRSHPAFHPNPNFVLGDALEVAAAIVDATARRAPFSLIRLGDGEGNFLDYRADYARFGPSDRRRIQYGWWGRKVWDEDEPSGVVAAFRDAVHTADAVGLPNLERLCRTAGVHQVTAPGSNGRSARGLIAVLDFAARPTDATQLLTSCHIHQALAFWGLWDLLLPRFGTVSLITCHRRLAGVLEERHGLRIAAVHRIPPEHKYAAAFEADDQGNHYPDVFETLRTELAKLNRGDVVLVAAGFLGKIYCAWIKQAGGIAIDIGSAADFWCGYETRSIVENSDYKSPNGLDERLVAALKDHPKYARLLPASLV